MTKILNSFPPEVAVLINNILPFYKYLPNTLKIFKFGTVLLILKRIRGDQVILLLKVCENKEHI